MELNMEITTEASHLKAQKTNVNHSIGQEQQPQSQERQVRRQRRRPRRQTQQQSQQQNSSKPQQPAIEQNAEDNKEKKKSSDSKKRDRRRRNRRRRRQENDCGQKANDEQAAVEKNPDSPETEVQLDFSLSELLREAQALEKQVGELQIQLKIDYSNIPDDKQKSRVVNSIAAEQMLVTEDEIAYVRQSLKKVYRRMITIDPQYAIQARINEKLWRNIIYVGIEELRQKIRTLDPSNFSSNQKFNATLQRLQRTLSDRIGNAFEFYHELNQFLYSTFQIKDTKLFGIDLMSLSYQNDEREHLKREQQRQMREGRFRGSKDKMKGQEEYDEKERLGQFLRSNHVRMGDLARYHAQQYQQQQQPIAKQKSKEYWSLARTCYQKAIDVYRKDGWPYSQLALVSISNGNAMDVVWYYCLSLAVQYPSPLSRHNLKSFYSRLRFNKVAASDNIESSRSTENNKEATVTDQISLFVESFLHMHRTVMFNDSGSIEDFPKISVASQLGRILSNIISSSTSAAKQEKQDILSGTSNNTGALLSIIRTTLTRCLTILLVSIWIAQERVKDQSKSIHRPVIQASQIHMFTFCFQLLIGVLQPLSKLSAIIMEQDNNEKEATDSAIERKKMSLKLRKLRSKVEDTLLPGLSIWFTFIQQHLAILQQFITSSSTSDNASSGSETLSASEIRHPHYHLKKELVKSVQLLLALIIQNPSFPQQSDELQEDYPSTTLPVSEDVILLGLKPLVSFHRTIDFSVLTGLSEQQQYNRAHVRWSRVHDAVKKIANVSSSLEINIQYTNGAFTILKDERAARQQKFMKALATQRLLEQVSSLEKNVDRMKLSSGYTVTRQVHQRMEDANQKEQEERRPLSKQVYTCVVDATCFLDALPKVKRWAQYHSPYITEENENTIVEVIVPLDVIDVLDRHKKGTAHMNLQARESIRYLDQVLSSSKTRSSNHLSLQPSSYLRTQKVSEKLEDWGASKKFWIGEDSRSNIVDDLLLSTTTDDEEEEEQQPEYETEDTDEEGDQASDTESVESDNSFIVGRRRRESDTEEEEEEEDNSENDSGSEMGTVDEEYDYAEDLEDDEEEDILYTYNDVPLKYRPIIGCLLYYFNQQQQQQEIPNADKLVLVTNDADLAWWAELFGNPKTRKRISVKAVNEWDIFVNKL
ncbi:hypothetical protein BDF20DRAFT_860776 [Mycotypha africana]|uniref:uncharacterized protein n=1 Tax=Mycotypha africana TaxID=64632 RepID=UPI002301C98D|nr:uncharacterized protein BDF20DRAFT_860776 [Mycotypha africana]KAI8984593.1 hypothetical protein BDF20DRAFT_860776 [Mycotypha africana]